MEYSDDMFKYSHSSSFTDFELSEDWRRLPEVGKMLFLREKIRRKKQAKKEAQQAPQAVFVAPVPPKGYRMMTLTYDASGLSPKALQDYEYQILRQSLGIPSGVVAFYEADSWEDEGKRYRALTYSYKPVEAGETFITRVNSNFPDVSVALSPEETWYGATRELEYMDAKIKRKPKSKKRATGKRRDSGMTSVRGIRG